MVDIKKTVFSLNILGPMGDDSQEFCVGTNDMETVLVKIGTIILSDNGRGELFLNGKGIYTSDIIDNIAEDVLFAAESYTDEVVSTITSFELIIVDELPEVGKKGYIYLVPKSADSSDDSSDEQKGYYEWIYINGKWEEIGDTDFDIADYYTSAEIDALFMPKTGGTFTGPIEVQGDITAHKIKFGNATITLRVDASTDETTVTIEGGTICLSGNIRINGDIYQTNGSIVQYVDGSND